MVMLGNAKWIAGKQIYAARLRRPDKDSLPPLDKMLEYATATAPEEEEEELAEAPEAQNGLRLEGGAFTPMAIGLGSAQVANMVALGAFVATTEALLFKCLTDWKLSLQLSM